MLLICEVFLMFIYDVFFLDIINFFKKEGYFFVFVIKVLR